MREKGRRKPKTIYLFALLFTAGCIVTSNTLKTDEVSGAVIDPVKVHLNDGRTAIFRSGARFTDQTIIGEGTLYALSLQDSTRVTEIDRDQIAAYEVFNSKVDAIPTIVGSLATIGGVTLGVVALSVAIFGSCPTVYSPSDSTMVLESELFSNSIAPMLEMRDVTRLQANTDENGQLVLEVRNEALETHYINQIGLLEVSHHNDEYIAPTASGKVLALSELFEANRISNTVGEDLRKVVEAQDGLAYESDLIQADESSIRWDTLRMVFPPVTGDSVAVLMTLRNSLFSTVLLYDYLLASQGPASLNWISRDLRTVSGAVALGDFDRTYNGLRVEQQINGTYSSIARIPNVGPIAWRELAVPVTATAKDSLRLQLIFLADSWRIDKLRLAGRASLAEVHFMELSELTDREGRTKNEILDRLQHPDDQYVVTYPGDVFTIRFDLGAPSSGSTTYLLESSGYYIEWVREQWVQEQRGAPRLFSENMVIEAQQTWSQTKAEFQQQFFKQRVPVK